MPHHRRPETEASNTHAMPSEREENEAFLPSSHTRIHTQWGEATNQPGKVSPVIHHTHQVGIKCKCCYTIRGPNWGTGPGIWGMHHLGEGPPTPPLLLPPLPAAPTPTHLHLPLHPRPACSKQGTPGHGNCTPLGTRHSQMLEGKKKARLPPPPPGGRLVGVSNESCLLLIIHY